MSKKCPFCGSFDLKEEDDGVDSTNVHFLGYHDQDLGKPANHDEIITRLLSFLPVSGPPSIVYVAMTNYGHADHLSMYFLVFEALERASFTNEIRVSVPQAFVGRTNPTSKNPAMQARFEHVDKLFPIYSTIKIDISKTITNKLRAIKSHETQMGMFANLVAPGDDFDAVLEDIFHDVYAEPVERFEVRKLASR